MNITTGGTFATPIGPSSLSHEHKVYGISKVLWFGKEDIYEVIILTSLGDLIDQLK